MPILSTYTFPFGFFTGFFAGINVNKTPQQVSTLQIGLNGTGALVKARRPDAEITQVISPLFNTADTIGEIEQAILPINQQGDALVTLTSPIMAQGVLYLNVPYFLMHPLRHPMFATLIRIFLTMHIRTPWPMSDADATISFYIFPALEDEHLTADVDGNWIHVDGGWPDGQQIADSLSAPVQSFSPELQMKINTALDPFSKIAFSHLYLLPGDGSRNIGVVSGDAGIEVAIGLVPKG
jgi:hypothetical protein